MVGIGASAGGLEALKQFFAAMPADSGMTFVVVQHLEPHSESRMAEILSKSTAMQVVQARDRLRIEPNTVYTNPPGRPLLLRGGRFSLGKPIESGHLEGVIDDFLTSLAAESASKAVCIILSGSSGLDGPRGIREVRAAGGMCMVQDPRTAQFDAMPQAAIKTGLVDYVLPPGEMPAVLSKFAQPQPPVEEAPPSAAAAGNLEAILKLLHTRAGLDYRCYKRTTIARRIRRRMGLRQITDMGDYLNVLRTEAQELAQLGNDMLIGVSSFFRDPEVFEALRREVIEPLVQSKHEDEPIRVWVPGCATGEEAYSVAMLLLEARAAADKSCRLQVFATDVDERALETARMGSYPLSIANQVSPARLEAFFTRRGQSFQVSKTLREAVVISRHNLLVDPPFSKLDLVSCRNVLIYLEPAAQKRILEVFSFALNVGGCLLLGKSEGVGAMKDVFEPVSGAGRFYRLKHSRRHVAAQFPASPSGRPAGEPGRDQPVPDSLILQQANMDSILRHFDAAVVLIDVDGKILYFHGQAEKYLSFPKGPPRFNLLDIVGGTLSAKIRRAIKKAVEEDETVSIPQVSLTREGAPRANVTVMPAGQRAGGKLLAVIFQDARPLAAAARSQVSAEDEPLVGQLEAEVKALRVELRNNCDGYDAAIEELKAANEEMMSMNEELQSTNEELEASKEELQSLNEEMTTVNSQLAEKVGELGEMNNDLANLLTATEIATLFLDNDLRIRRFTPRATELLNLIESDVGRPVSHITQNFTGIDLAADVAQVLKTLLPVEKEVQGRDGRWYTVRILPYRTLDNRIDGSVITFSNVTRLKEIESNLRFEKTYAQGIVETVHHPLIVLDRELCVLSANQAFCRTFQVRDEDLHGQKLYTLGNGQWDIRPLRDVLRAVAEQGSKLENFEVEHAFPGIGRRIMLLNARRIEDAGAVPQRILVAIEDITDRKDAEKRLERADEELKRSNKDLEQFAHVVSHDLQEPLRMITGFQDLLTKQLGPDIDVKAQEYAALVLESARRMQAMIRDLLDFSRVGTQEARFSRVDLDVALKQALQGLHAGIEQAQAKVTSDPLPKVRGNATQLARVFQNLIGNAVKFRSRRPLEVHVIAARSPEGWVISVRDNGIGIDMQFADRVFQVFQRLHTRKQYEGTGMGLAICRRIVEHHGGRIWLESEKGKGATFHFTLPPAKDET